MNEEEIPENLILQLKYVCDKIGDKYVENKPKISAKIFQKIGKHIEQTCRRQLHPNKISLIRCAGLYNAALARHPDNIEEIRQDLRDLCHYILDTAKATCKVTAKATCKVADLIEQAEIVKKHIDQMRKWVNKRLDKIAVFRNINEENSQELSNEKRRRIVKIQSMQIKMTKKFKNLMKEIGDYCESALGNRPCDYALVGMGSLARHEITPYSNFHNMILLEDGCENRDDYDNILEYFRWFAAIYHIVLINLQETIIPSLAIPGLNDSSTPKGDWFLDTCTNGISFDGFMATACKMPLGNLHHNLSKEESFELIKPVSVMVEYTKSQSKTGNYLRDILLTNCFVSGSLNVYEEFARQCKGNQTTNVATLKSQVEDELNSFGAKQKLSDHNAFNRESSLKLNIKRIMYRSSTLFISALGLHYNISAASCFGIIDELFESKRIDFYVHQKLSFVAAIACEIRSRIYMEKKGQQDDISKEEMIKIFSESDILTYFQAAYVLQCHICQILNIRNDFFYTKPYLLNIGICWFFGFKERCFALIQRLNKCIERSKQNLEYHNIDECLSQLENEIVETNNVSNDSRKSFNANLDQERLIYFIENVAGFLFATGVYDVCTKYYNKYLTFLGTVEQKMSHDAESACRILGLSFMYLKKFDKALSYFQDSLSIFKSKKSIAHTYFTEKVDTSELNVTSEITSCSSYLLQEAQDIHSAPQTQSEMKTYISVLYNIAVCLFEKEEYKSSIRYLEQVLSENEIFDENCDIAIAMYNYLAANLVCLEKYEEALKYLEKSKSFAEIFRIGYVLYSSRKMVIAISYFSFLLNHAEEGCLCERLLLQVQITQALCKIETKNEAIDDLKEAEKKLSSLSTDIASDQLAQQLFLVIGAWHYSNNNFSSSLSYFDKSIRIGDGIYNNYELTCSTNSASEFRRTIDHLLLGADCSGKCYLKQKNYDLAISCFKKAMEFTHLFEQLALLDDDAQNNISECIQAERDESQQCLEKKVKVQNKIALSYGVKFNFKMVSKYLGFCQTKKCNWQSALKWFFRNRSISLSETMNTDDDTVEVLIGIGNCCQKTDQFDSALSYFEKALKTQRAMQVSHETYERCAQLCCFICLCLCKMEKFHEALHPINLAQSYCRQMGFENEFLLNKSTNMRSLCIKKLDEQIRRNMPF